MDAQGDAWNVVKANQAKLYADIGLVKHANRALAGVDKRHADICGVLGETYLLLSDFDNAAAHLGAIKRTEATGRSAAIEACLLATTYVAAGEDRGFELSSYAIAAVEAIGASSLRTRDRLGPLKVA